MEPRQGVAPRVRGSGLDRRRDGSLFGVAPRVRGKGELLTPPSNGKGCSPACAGEGHGLLFVSALSRVQPRVCGGKAPCLGQDLVEHGAAPRVRGKGMYTIGYGWVDWCSPACAGEGAEQNACPLATRCSPAGAGESQVAHSESISDQVQARGCGGRWVTGCYCEVPEGVAPRVRGNGIGYGSAQLTHWWSPAGAGEGLASNGGTRMGQVEPRWCGGRSVLRDDDLGNGWSPAGAGEGCIFPSTGITSAVEPRGCGGRGRGLVLMASGDGGAPRVRGKVAVNQDRCGSGRWSPAGAGEGLPCYRALGLDRVEPRGCGGRLYQDDLVDYLDGGAPRVRGKDWG